MEDIMVLAGGIVPKHQIPELMKMGIRKVFLPGTSRVEIVNYIQRNLR
jgi:methylmalonyl-CoA mutase C-terminal domain/subunit